ncbi:38188_t:CDS:1 [Gigaspora margarita]|uniref:38188_t:CDS:1 n=1 Tax=Gigaspora margarita TaxID=4874 RepID=A0ABM8VYZ4_GIGMA|nr:38188_t:CDS:1 [Gigaspora margarita]
MNTNKLKIFAVFLILIIKTSSAKIAQCSGVDPTTGHSHCKWNYQCAASFGDGFVCSNSPKCCPEYKRCIYGCHSDDDCNFGCDKTMSPHWLCTCEFDEDCYGPGICQDGHCVNLPNNHTTCNL